jgi:alkylated DNA repair dioxygenase AlkB
MKTTDQLRWAGIIVLVLLLAFLFYQKQNPRSRTPVPGPGGGQSMSLSRTDANGVAWSLDQVGESAVATEPDRPKAGPPILVQANVQRVADREMSIGLALQGQAGEQYRPVVKKNGTPLAAPKLRILNEAGEVITQGSFQYG